MRIIPHLLAPTIAQSLTKLSRIWSDSSLSLNVDIFSLSFCVMLQLANRSPVERACVGRTSGGEQLFRRWGGVKAKLAKLQIQLGHLSNVEERSCVTNASDCLHTEEFRCRNISPAALCHCTETLVLKKNWNWKCCQFTTTFHVRLWTDWMAENIQRPTWISLTIDH